jgi:hypothetical protein
VSPVFDGWQAFIRREQAPALRTFVFLRIVGSGFCPISLGGRPRAMLAPDASVGKAENTC